MFFDGDVQFAFNGQEVALAASGGPQGALLFLLLRLLCLLFLFLLLFLYFPQRLGLSAFKFGWLYK